MIFGALTNPVPDRSHGRTVFPNLVAWPSKRVSSRHDRHHRRPPAGDEPAAAAGALRLRALVAHCHLGLGKLYGCTGKREEAQEHLTSATTMYREMDMRFWLEQAEAIMGALP